MFKLIFVLLAICLLIFDDHLAQANEDSKVDNEEISRLSKGSISKRKCSLLKNAYLSDVNLIAVDRNGSEEFVEVIPAHKLILEYSSPVFERIITDSDSFSAVIRIEQFSLEIVDILLKFIYCNQMEVTDEQLMNVIEAAEFYELEELACHLTSRLTESVTPKNLFTIFQNSRQIKSSAVRKMVHKIIQKDTKALLDTASIEFLDRSIVELILNQPILNIDEYRLFDFVLDWSRRQAQQMEKTPNNSPNGESVRQTMGNLLYSIRIPSMDAKLFLDGPVTSQIFTAQEALDLISYQMSGLKPINRIVNRFKHLNSRYSTEVEFNGPTWGRWGNTMKNVLTNETRLSSFKSDFDFCLQEVVIVSDLVSKFNLSILDQKGVSIMSTESDPSEKQNNFVFNFVDDEPCLSMQANTSYLLIVQFEEIELAHHLVSSDARNFERKHKLGKLLLKFATDHYVLKSVQFSSIKMLI